MMDGVIKIAILYIATGRYSVFWKDLYLSAERYFIKNADKDYFIFTDNEHIDFENNGNVYKFHQPKLGWPYDTMMRFEIFLSQEEKLKAYDYIFFFNANLLCVSPIGEEILPTKEQDGLTVCKHPGGYNKPVDRFAYERNPQSTSYVPFGEGKYYVQGALNGGIAADYLAMCRWCNQKIHEDLDTILFRHGMMRAF